jgi:hypothetical protein
MHDPAPNFSELRYGEVRGACLPRTPRRGSEQKVEATTARVPLPVSSPTLRLHPLGRLALGGAQWKPCFPFSAIVTRC